jgi:hypothetical protein
MVVALGAVPLGLGQAVLAGARGAGRLVRRARTRTTRVDPPTDETAPAAAPAPAPAAEAIGRRLALTRVGGIGVYGLTGSALGWGMARGRHAFEIDELVVKIPGLPRALDGYTLAQISDIHVGVFVGEREIDEGLARLAEVRADLVVVTGDLVDFETAYAPLLARALGRLRPRDGVVGILGNHDHYAGAAEVVSVMREAGVEILVNRGRVVRPDDGGGFALLGVDDLSSRKRGARGPSLEAALADVPGDLPRVLLAHQPMYFESTRGQVALQLSGHTHGGQINPGFRPAGMLMRYVAGRYTRAGSTLYVNRGFGVAGPPSRVGAPPEVTKVVLVAG